MKAVTDPEFSEKGRERLFLGFAVVAIGERGAAMQPSTFRKREITTSSLVREERQRKKRILFCCLKNNPVLVGPPGRQEKKNQGASPAGNLDPAAKR